MDKACRSMRTRMSSLRETTKRGWSRIVKKGRPSESLQAKKWLERVMLMISFNRELQERIAK